jgi:RNA polymerase sigma-70 factor (sigma-E family)
LGYEGEFSSFVAAAWPSLVRTGRLLAPDPATGEDLAQAALLKTYAQWQSVDDPMAYTRAVLARLAIRAGRRRWRGEVPHAVLPERATQPDALKDVDSADAVERALAVLPAEQRAVLVLRYYCDCSEVEIAAALQCSVGTVKSRAHRALAALRMDGSLDDVEVGDG